MCAVTFEFDHERSVQVALPTEILKTFENALTESQERCRALQRSVKMSGASSRTNLPVPTSKYSDVDIIDNSENLHVLALRVTQVSLYEQLDGSTVGMRFDHPDGATSGALMPVECVPVFLQKVRDAQAIAVTRRVKDSPSNP